MREFLNQVSEKYEIIVFCSGSSLYCKPVLNYIEEEKKIFSHRLYNSHVLFDNSSFAVKYYDFLLSEGRTVDNLVIVEVNPASYSLIMCSGIPIAPYKVSQTNDQELARLANYLEFLASSSSIHQTISASVQSVYTIT